MPSMKPGSTAALPNKPHVSNKLSCLCRGALAPPNHSKKKAALLCLCGVEPFFELINLIVFLFCTVFFIEN